VSVIWGPWSGVGMVSDLEAHLGRRGLGMIAPEIGAPLLADELERGRKGDVEVIMAGDLGSLLDEPGALAGARAEGPTGDAETQAADVALPLAAEGVAQ
jgi:hypothetical protein